MEDEKEQRKKSREQKTSYQATRRYIAHGKVTVPSNITMVDVAMRK